MIYSDKKESNSHSKITAASEDSDRLDAAVNMLLLITL